MSCKLTGSDWEGVGVCWPDEERPRCFRFEEPAVLLLAVDLSGFGGTYLSEDDGCRTRFISCFPSPDHRSTVHRKNEQSTSLVVFINIHALILVETYFSSTTLPSSFETIILATAAGASGRLS